MNQVRNPGRRVLLKQAALGLSIAPLALGRSPAAQRRRDSVNSTTSAPPLETGCAEITSPRNLDIVDASNYAIDPTGVTASDVGLNAAIQDAISQKKKLVIPSGIFLLNAPLLCYSLGGVVSKIDIEGQGVGYPSGNTSFPTSSIGGADANTILCINSQVLPAVIFQTNRSSSLKNISIMGLNIAPLSQGEPNNSQTNYVTAGCSTNRYVPYCAICIDPMSTASPLATYPGLSYISAFNGSGTTGLLIEDVFISCFVVGIANGVSGAGALQGDTVYYRNVNVSGADVAFVSGNTQSKGCTVEKGIVYYCRYVLDTVTYGTQIGYEPNVISAVNTIHTYAWLNCSGHAPMAMQGCYSELLKTIGKYGFLGLGGVFATNCQFLFATVAANGFTTERPPYTFECLSPYTFKLCSFGIGGGLVDVWNFISGNNGASLEQCTLSGTAYTDVPPIIGMEKNGVYGIRVVDVTTTAYGAASLLLSDSYPLRSYGIAGYSHNGRLHATWNTRLVQNANVSLYYQPATATPYVSTAATALTIVRHTLTFTMTVLGTVQINDILLWTIVPQGFAGVKRTVPAFKVTSIDGSGNCIGTAIFDVNQYDTVANTATHTGANIVLVVRHQWAPSQALTATTATDATLASISPMALIPGDFVQGVGIAAGTRVVSVNVGTASAVLSKATTTSATGVTLYDGRLLAPTMTTAF